MESLNHTVLSVIPCSAFILLGLVIEFAGFSQVNNYKDSASFHVVKSPSVFLFDTIVKNTPDQLEMNLRILASGKTDTISLQKIQKQQAENILQRIQELLHSGSPFISLKNAVVNYNFTYRSKLDTPFTGNHIQQHFANLSADILVAEKFPLRVAVYERRSNSEYFRNYTDVRLEFNAPEYRRMRAEKLRKYFDELLNKLQDPHLESIIENQAKLFKDRKSFVNNPEVIKQYLESKEIIITPSCA